jgi:hypothetical protein
MKRVVFLSLNLLWTTFVLAQVVNIPDANFKKALVDNPSINTNKDAEIQVSEAVAYTGEINVFNKKIQNLTGIEAFVNLTSLNCNYNKLTILDVSKNVALKSLSCGKNQLSTLDLNNNVALISLGCFLNSLNILNVSKNIALNTLSCEDNNLNTLDVSKNIALEYLYCSNTFISSLNISNNLALKALSCSDNHLSTLDVTKNVSLEYLEYNNNKISVIDVTKNVALEVLSCDNNTLSNLDVSKNVVLKRLFCSSNQLKGLDVSKNTSLSELSCYKNLLTYLNVKNGANNLLTFFYANINPPLKCIEVDNPNAKYTNWTKDSTASYSSNCMIPTKDISSEGFLQLYPNPSTDSFAFSNLSEAPLSVTIYDLHGKLVQHYPSPASNYDISTLCNGLYIVKAQFANGEAIAKLVKGE